MSFQGGGGVHLGSGRRLRIFQTEVCVGIQKIPRSGGHGTPAFENGERARITAHLRPQTGIALEVEGSRHDRSEHSSALA